MKALVLLMTVATLALGGCSFDKNSNPEDKVKAENTAYLREKYSRVTGEYYGTLKNVRGKVQMVRLIVTTFDVPNGTDSRGQENVTPTLNSRIAFESTVKPDVVLNKVSYRDDTIPPQINMTSEAKDTLNPDGVTAQLEVHGDHLIGTINSSGSTLGTANLKLLTRETSGPEAGFSEAENRRIIRVMEPIVGDYIGMVSTKKCSGRFDDFWINVQISVGSKPDPRYPTQNRQIPTLIGVLSWRHIPGADEPILNIDYQAETDSLTMVSNSSTGGGNRDDILIRGTLVDGVIEGSYRGSDFKTCPMKLKKQ